MPATSSGQSTDSNLDLEAVLGALTEAVLVIGSDRTIAWTNAAAESIFGRSGAQLRGTPATETFAQAPWLAELASRVGRDRPFLRAEGNLGAAGEDMEFMGHAVALLEGAAPMVVVTLHASDRALRLATQDRERARLSELHRLVGQLGHEINNPLSGIRGAAQLLGRRLGKKHEADEYTDMIVRQADRMAELVASLMSLEAPVTSLRPCNIHRVLSDVLLLLKAEAAECGVTLAQEFDPSLPDVIGDPDRLQQLFINLAKNAMAATAGTEKGQVVIRTLMEHGFHVTRDARRVHYIRVEVRDNGRGLDADTLDHMFEPLYSRRHGGHGMGLAVARSIVTAHRGSVAAENLEGGGACLRVLLEVAEEST
jgi:two-component system nitrogen regulation sensor histidine kinase GlnL